MSKPTPSIFNDKHVLSNYDTVGKIQHWVTKSPGTPYARTMGSTWERWAPGELCVQFNLANMFARCEVAAYTHTQERADLVVRSYPTSKEKPHWDIINFKCLNRWSDDNKAETLAHFLSPQRMGEAIQPVIECDLRPEYNNNTDGTTTSSKCAIGLFCVQDVRDHFEWQTMQTEDAMNMMKQKFEQLPYKSAEDGKVYGEDVRYRDCGEEVLMVWIRR